MLTELRVRDLAVIADVTLPFQPGLNVLTGETGAGKSMVVDALALLLGERASADVVRPGAEKTVVEGAFEFASAVHRHLLPPFAELGIELEEGRLVLKREVLREGKSRAWVNGSPVTISVLSEIGSLLVAHGHALDVRIRVGVEHVALRIGTQQRLRLMLAVQVHEQRPDLGENADRRGRAVHPRPRLALAQDFALQDEPSFF